MSKICTDEGAVIKGDRIVGEARKISEPVVIVKSGRHKAQRVVLRDNAVCRIAKKYKFIK
ncbi:MAG TPA: hypothetical protein VHO92_05870 [Methanobacterium sp.]|nr:hypothetical protein [Methanobacterium sp.]